MRYGDMHPMSQLSDDVDTIASDSNAQGSRRRNYRRRPTTADDRCATRESHAEKGYRRNWHVDSYPVAACAEAGVCRRVTQSSTPWHSIHSQAPNQLSGWRWKPSAPLVGQRRQIVHRRFNEWSGGASYFRAEGKNLCTHQPLVSWRPFAAGRIDRHVARWRRGVQKSE
jgi:hypothetical protein